MRVNIDYVRGLMGCILRSPNVRLTLGELKNKGFDIHSDNGIFHTLLLIEQGFFSNENLENEDRTLTLTESGVAFIRALETPGTIETLREIGYSSLSFLEFASTRLARQYEYKKAPLA